MPAARHGETERHTSTELRTRALNQFLAGVELKAYRRAQTALRNEADALDAVQDAMLQLARAYSQRPEDEWKPLFYRILENRIRDMQRRRAVRNRFMAWLPGSHRGEDEPRGDALDELPSSVATPVAVLEMNEVMHALQRALEALPRRQQQAFMLRSLEGFDVAQTALVMGCSQGSVKTHYFRALQALRAQLGEFRS
jgi:RNA polymerase sigma-70 factor (ECF subfamily)